MCVYIKYMYSFFKKFPIWTDNASLKSHRQSKKNSKSRHEKPSFELLVGVIQETTRTLVAFAVDLDLPTRGERKPPFLKTPCHFRHRAQRTQAGCDLKATSLEDWLELYQNVLCKQPRKGSNWHFYPALTTVNHNHDQHDTVTLREQWWHINLVSN